jgi:hypothetical protein
MTPELLALEEREKRFGEHPPVPCDVVRHLVVADEIVAPVEEVPAAEALSAASNSRGWQMVRPR